VDERTAPESHDTVDTASEYASGLHAERGVPLAREELVVSTQVLETGRVRVHKTVHEREQPVNKALYTDEIDVERVSVNRFVVPPQAHYEGDVFVIPVTEEVLVRRLRVREEIRLRRRRQQAA
jgi:stress response protein YsnF